jgi:predicted dehydrogenase
VVTGASNLIKVGLVGCGGRGSGAAAQACRADDGNVLWAVGDLFQDPIDDPKLGHLEPLKSELGKQVDVPKERRFSGWDAYKGVIEACDVILLATPPHFRPLQLEAVAKAGKHCFCEKPVGVDPVGVRKVMEVSKIFTEKNKSLVSGLCWRYDEAKRAVVEKIHEGAIGDIRALQHNYLSGGLWTKPRQDAWSDMEWQIRNWLYFYWLSGDHIVEQHIHSIDKMMWIMKDVPPVKVMATGGRIQRVAPQYGNVYDHFNTIFEWENGVRAFTCCRQFVNCAADVSDYAYGVDGVAAVGADRPFITGKNPAKFKKSKHNMYDSEHVALFKSIRDNTPINNGDYMCKSTMCAIMARTSAYTGKEVRWVDMMGGTVIDPTTNTEIKVPASTQSFSLEKYGWGPRVVDPIAVPGASATKGNAAAPVEH